MNSEWKIWPRPEDRLDAWIEEATYKLCEDAKQRLDSEYRDHYAIAVQAAQAEGCSEEEAIHRAEAELGDPRDVNKAAKQAYLTQNEAKWLNTFYDTKRPIKKWLHLLLFVPLLFSMSHITHSFAERWMHVWVVLLFCYLSFHMVAPRLKPYQAILGEMIIGSIWIASLPHMWYLLAYPFGVPLPFNEPVYFFIDAIQIFALFGNLVIGSSVLRKVRVKTIKA